MKVGLSYSRCVRDIVDGNVDIDDVLVIVARTNFDPRVDEQWASIWNGYGGGTGVGSIWSAPEWADYPPEDEQKFRDISIQLQAQGKLFQPRKDGGNPSRRPEIWLETVLPQSELDKNPTVKQAWDNFQVIAGLSNVNLDKEYR